MHKFLDIFLIILLVYVVGLQLNDPDPLFWICLYLGAALAPLLHLVDKPFAGRSYILGLSTGYCLAGIAMVLGGATEYLGHIGQESIISDMSPDRMYIEETRELLGSLIALIIVLYYSWLTHRKNKI